MSRCKIFSLHNEKCKSSICKIYYIFFNSPLNFRHVCVDNPQAVIAFKSHQEWLDAREGKLVSSISGIGTEEASVRFCDQANIEFKNGNLRKAIALYTQSLEARQNVRALSNRALAFLKFEKYSSALLDAEAVLALDPMHIKCLYRSAFALLLLQRPLDSQVYIDIFNREMVAQKAIAGGGVVASDEDMFLNLQKDVKRAISEQEGIFDMKRIKIEAKLAVGELSRKHMNFQSPCVLQKHCEGEKGRGMFARHFIPASTLIMVEKALMYSKPNHSDNLLSINADSTRADTGARANALPMLVRKLLTHPEIGCLLYSLSGGNKYPPSEFSIDDEEGTRIDILRIRSIIYNNWFGVGDVDEVSLMAENQRWREELGRLPTMQEIEAVETHRKMSSCSALFVRPSFFNHSCSPNVICCIYGDFMFLFTNRPIAAGDELTVRYLDVRQSLNERSEIFRTWNQGNGFKCNCDRCAYAKTHPDLQKIEVEIDSEYEKAVGLCQTGISMSEACDLAINVKRRRALLGLLRKHPLIAHASLSKLLDLIAGAFNDAGNSREALVHYRELVNVESMLFGDFGNIFLLKSRLRIAMQCLALRDSPGAVEEIASIRRSWLGSLSRFDLAALCRKYASNSTSRKCLPQILEILESQWEKNN